MTEPNWNTDHPHRVSLTKPMLAKHIRTAAHPYGRCLEDEVSIRRWTKDELSAVHFFLHEGNPPKEMDPRFCGHIWGKYRCLRCGSNQPGFPKEFGHNGNPPRTGDE